MKKIGKLLFLAVAPAVLAFVALFLWCADLLSGLQLLFRRRRLTLEPATPASPYEPPRHASIVIPNWNGRDLLEKYLQTVLAACSPSDEVMVVDNASSDGSAEFLRRNFPQVRVLALDRNHGFGGGANAGVRAARHRIVVLLNNDMRAAPDFLAPLLAGFTDEWVFAVSAQIFFSDSSRRREETGLTEGRFEKGFIRVRHVADDQIHRLYPTFYAGGGSTAYDREKFLQLGGFDPLFEPFYLEDTDLSYGAWRRGWKVLYQPKSCLYHEHRATIGKHYSPEAILAYLQKNYVVMVWKNVHRWRWLVSHFLYLYGHMALCCAGRATETRTTVGAFLLALQELPQALRSRRAALLRARVKDRSVFERVRPAVFRDTFLPPASPLPDAAQNRPLHLLVVSPYSIYPPLHGGAVLMLQAIQELAKRHQVSVLMFVDRPEEIEPNRALGRWAQAVEIFLRRPVEERHFSLKSHAQRTFFDPQFAALLDKLVFLQDIDLIQFEYTQLAQYHLPLQHIPQCLFEHDVYFRSVQRQLLTAGGRFWVKAREFLEWLRAMRYELAAAGKFDAVFACHDEERRLLESFLNGRRPIVLAGLRTAVDVSSYPFPGGPRRPDSLLFVGNFQHRPNVEGLQFFCREIWPLLRARHLQATLTVVGARTPSEPKPMSVPEGVFFRGQVPDIREPLAHHAVFVCPIRTGAGVRVKLLEAFASGIPVVSTSLGAEGIAATSGRELLLADSPSEFASACWQLLESPQAAAAMAAHARRLVETTYDWPLVMKRLDQVYRQLVAEKTPRTAPPGPG